MTLLGADTFHIVSLGCKVNRVEADSIGVALLANGSSVAQQEAADIIIVNTCTVTGEADKKARKAVRHALAANPVALVLVTGCAAAIDADVFLSMDPRVRVMGKGEIERVLNAGKPDGQGSDAGAAGGDTPQGDAPRASLLRFGEGFRTRVGIKVQDGCDHACTYCIVHVARGPARSMPVGDVVREAREHLRAGAKELVLAGIDIGAYHDGDVVLSGLVRMLLDEADMAAAVAAPRRAAMSGRKERSETRPGRVRISSIEPGSIDEELIEILASSEGRLCRHLHLPLQSGSTGVLREMDRPYTAEGYLDLVRRLRARIPALALSTDIIVGFPGETESDFQATCDLAREAGFMRLHVFPYSPRRGTPAAERADQVPPEEKRERAARLRELGKNLAIADKERRAGTAELALVQGETCLTESYHELPAPAGEAVGSLARHVW